MENEFLAAQDTQPISAAPPGGDPPAIPPNGAPIGAASYPDRSTGLVIFGVIQIILGLLAGLMVPFVALGAFLSRLTPDASMRPGQLLSGVVTYLFLALLLLTLGVGSVQMKRWARALTLVISWYWMITGILITILLTAVLPISMHSMLQMQPTAAPQAPAFSAGVMAVILTIIIVFAAFFLMVVPISFVIFYGRRDVAETCQRRDPLERWTDRVPLPVLGASIVFTAQALYMLSAGIGTPIFPFFGRYLTGAAGFTGFLMFASLDIFLAISFLYRKPAAWWIAIVTSPVRLISLALTYARADLMQAYSKMGLSDQQMQLLNSSPFLRGHVILWWSLISAVLFFGYLLWLKRYFNAPMASQQPQIALPEQAI
jgi:hypothetical protein